ncbi:unnamed protein product [[Actinomadura] parvosata subsp. kistnae]|uniref:hypothetical protein n=1 Tax=[Actinomadura] parvosata TaxID=1955412 RepID=UPI000D28E555|nr:hypothetical protein [Nonomuraea sp. ATCC 55076]SPL99326.1 unnamed protein product [Actinomadura parvosata subsp. kistnae]
MIAKLAQEHLPASAPRLVPVQDGMLGCLKAKSSKDCPVVDDWYMKRAKVR